MVIALHSSQLSRHTRYLLPRRRDINSSSSCNGASLNGESVQTKDDYAIVIRHPYARTGFKGKKQVHFNQLEIVAVILSEGCSSKGEYHSLDLESGNIYFHKRNTKTPAQFEPIIRLGYSNQLTDLISTKDTRQQTIASILVSKISELNSEAKKQALLISTSAQQWKSVFGELGDEAIGESALIEMLQRETLHFEVDDGSGTMSSESKLQNWRNYLMGKAGSLGHSSMDRRVKDRFALVDHMVLTMGADGIPIQVEPNAAKPTVLDLFDLHDDYTVEDINRDWSSITASLLDSEPISDIDPNHHDLAADHYLKRAITSRRPDVRQVSVDQAIIIRRALPPGERVPNENIRYKPRRRSHSKSRGRDAGNTILTKDAANKRRRLEDAREVRMGIRDHLLGNSIGIETPGLAGIMVNIAKDRHFDETPEELTKHTEMYEFLVSRLATDSYPGALAKCYVDFLKLNPSLDTGSDLCKQLKRHENTFDIESLLRDAITLLEKGGNMETVKIYYGAIETAQREERGKGTREERGKGTRDILRKGVEMLLENNGNDDHIQVFVNTVTAYTRHNYSVSDLAVNFLKEFQTEKNPEHLRDTFDRKLQFRVKVDRIKNDGVNPIRDVSPYWSHVYCFTEIVNRYVEQGLEIDGLIDEYITELKKLTPSGGGISGYTEQLDTYFNAKIKELVLAKEAEEAK